MEKRYFYSNKAMSADEAMLQRGTDEALRLQQIIINTIINLLSPGRTRPGTIIVPIVPDTIGDIALRSADSVEPHEIVSITPQGIMKVVQQVLAWEGFNL